MSTLHTLKIRRAVRAIQGFVATVLAFSAARHWMDKDPNMQEVWRWLAGASVAVLIVTSLAIHGLTERLKASASIITPKTNH